MRVIAGTYRSRPLVSPAGTTTRPTSDRLRETLFNILAPKIPGARFVDLYAGTGAVGIEAISRGAEFVWFAEKAEPALKTLRKNLATLKIANGFALEDRGTGALLQRLTKLGKTIDAVYLDPPYEAEDEYAGTLGWLGSGAGLKVLAEDAVVVAEHGTRAKVALAERYGGLVRTRVYTQGEATLSFYGVAEK
jgi:16S rRNA (guanine966-N2)-methyltransferase